MAVVAALLMLESLMSGMSTLGSGGGQMMLAGQLGVTVVGEGVVVGLSTRMWGQHTPFTPAPNSQGEERREGTSKKNLTQRTKRRQSP